MRKDDRYTSTIQNPKKSKTLFIILAAIGIFIAFCIGTVSIVGLSFHNSEAYKISVKEIERNTQLISEIGKINGYGWMPIGSINISNGEGKADLSITVKGSIKDTVIHTSLSKAKTKKWKLLEMN